MLAERSAGGALSGQAPRPPINLGLFRLLLGITSVESVRRIRAAADAMRVYVWVMTDDERPEDSKRIYLMERDYLGLPDAVPLDLQVVPLGEVDEQRLPAAETIFERPRA
ncbi:MAG TPA: hypothetical protein VFC93_04935 [Chloroflexota bacterium]|nr:hypothetical protein [Chloroflexota bacterium]